MKLEYDGKEWKVIDRKDITILDIITPKKNLFKLFRKHSWSNYIESDSTVIFYKNCVVCFPIIILLLMKLISYNISHIVFLAIMN